VDVRILMVTPYPPIRDGIAAYAVQTVARLRAEGDDVEVLSPWPSAAHHHLDLRGPRGPLALAKRVGAYDKVIVQFHPDVFFRLPPTAKERLTVSAALTAAFRAAKDVEVVVHEVDYRVGAGHGPVAVATRAMWQSVDRVVVHTADERSSFAAAFGVPEDRISVEAHGQHFQRRTRLDRTGARARLGIPDDQFMFLSIGFIQPHKGFDRSIHAFDGLAAAGCRLDIVGSVRVEDPAYLEHLEELRRLAAATPGVAVHAGYLGDEEFDRWLVAADVVVLPYRHIWSSGVMERAALYDRPVIATRVGGLAQQAGDEAVLVDDDEGLAAAMREAAGTGEAPGAADPWDVGGATDRDAVMAEVRARAAARRGTAARPARAGDAGPAPSRVSAPLRRLPALGLPEPASARFGAGFVKRLVRRLTAWELEPVVEQVNQLQRAAVEATERSAVESDEQ
jgi:glycosyltransferase involved in cell wall biosynthesis